MKLLYGTYFNTTEKYAGFHESVTILWKLISDKYIVMIGICGLGNSEATKENMSIILDSINFPEEVDQSII